MIREEIDVYDEARREALEDDEDDTEQAGSTQRVYLGSKLRPVTFEELEAAHLNDRRFLRFRRNLGEYLTESLPAYGIVLQDSKPVKYNTIDQVHL